jgi:hypothetical protein
MPISDLLQAMANESVERIQDAWKAGTQARRQHYLTTDFLSDNLFNDPGVSLQASADEAA